MRRYSHHTKNNFEAYGYCNMEVCQFIEYLSKIYIENKTDEDPLHCASTRMTQQKKHDIAAPV